MSLLVEDLIQVLSGEVALYDQVLVLLYKERGALASKQPREALDLARQKETLLLKIRTLEESRRLICVRLAKLWNVASSAINLTEIRGRCEGETETRLGEIHGLMRDCMDKLRAANQTNRQLCRQGLETVRAVLQSVAEGVSEKNGAGGYPEMSAAKSGAGAANKGVLHWTA